LWILIFLGVFSFWIEISTSQKHVNNRPVIGVLDQPNSDDLQAAGCTGETYLPADYVKWIESAGGRVVPIPHNATQSKLQELFQYVNGILFTGGDLSLMPDTVYYQTALYLYNLAIAENNKGIYFPVWGTCQGFQLLCILSAQNESVDQRYKFDSENLPLALNFTDLASSSRLFGHLPSRIYRRFHTEDITINLHHDGIPPSFFQTSNSLKKTLKLLSTNADRKGKEFASSFEGIQFPFYGVQFHPERNAFEWDHPEKTPHTGEAVEAMQYLARFYVSETKKNQHQFPEGMLDKLLIYNYQATFTLNLTSEGYPDFQTYCFHHLWENPT